MGLVPVRVTVPRLLTFAIKPFRRGQLDWVRVAAAMSGKVAAMRCERAWGARLYLAAKKPLEAKGRDNGVLISLSTSLATTLAEASFVFRFLFPGWSLPLAHRWSWFSERSPGRGWQG